VRTGPALLSRLIPALTRPTPSFMAGAHDRDTLVLAGIVVAYVASSMILALVLDRTPALPRLAGGYLLLLLPIPGLLLLSSALGVARANRDSQGKAIAAAWSRWRAELGLSSAITIALLPLFMAGFTTFKSQIPALQPFSFWDEKFASWDQAIHGGDPWALVQPLLDAPVATAALDLMYYPLWFIVSFGAWVFIATGRHPRRQQFLVTFLLLWIVLGTVGGALLSSVGPILYDRVAGDGGRFAGLIHHLESVNDSYPLIALAARDRLWDAYMSGIADVGTGISAMPSLHVAIVTLCAIFAWHCSRRAGLILTAYAAAILLASVHLGWHYAIDGYVSIIATVAIWSVAGWALRRAGQSRSG
jgi:hypothetical protein